MMVEISLGRCSTVISASGSLFLRSNVVFSYVSSEYGCAVYRLEKQTCGDKCANKWIQYVNFLARYSRREAVISNKPTRGCPRKHYWTTKAEAQKWPTQLGQHRPEKWFDEMLTISEAQRRTELFLTGQMPAFGW
jgi:hypothetical protein